MLEKFLQHFSRICYDFWNFSLITQAISSWNKKCGDFNLQALNGGALHYTNIPMDAMYANFEGCKMIMLKTNLYMSVQIMDNIKYSDGLFIDGHY